MADIYLSVGPNIAKIKPTEFTSAVQKKINSLSEKSLPKVSVGIQVDKRSINTFKSELASVVKSISVDNKGLIKIDIGSLDEASKKIRETSQSIQELQKSTNKKGSFLDGTALVKAQATVQGLINKFSELKSKSSGSKLIPGIDKTISDLNELNEALKGSDKVPYQDYKNQIDAANASLKLFTEEQKALNREAASAPQNLAKGTEEYNRTLAEAIDLLKQVTNAQKNWTAAKYGKSSGSYDQLDGVADSLRDIIDNFDTLSRSEILSKLDGAKKSFKDITSDVKGAGEATSVFLSKLKGIPGQLAKLVGMQRIFSAIVSGMRSMINTVIDLDSAMTQLQIVTGATDAEMTRFMANSTQLAKDLGKSISDVTSSIEVFSRLGYSLQDASELTRYATVMSNVAAVNTDEATTGMTAIIKGFNMDVENAEHVADVLVEIGQKYAVSAGELMSAFERSGAALAASGTSFEKSAGIIAAGNAAVQNANTVGKVMPIRTVMCA